MDLKCGDKIRVKVESLNNDNDRELMYKITREGRVNNTTGTVSKVYSVGGLIDVKLDDFSFSEEEYNNPEFMNLEATGYYVFYSNQVEKIYSTPKNLSISEFYIIETDTGNGIKYISKDFPRLFSHTITLNKTKKFNNRDKANEFIKKYKSELSNPVVKKVVKKLEVVED